MDSAHDPTGVETLTVNAADGASIYDAAGNAAVANQSGTDNQITMNDQSGPTVTYVDSSTSSTLYGIGATINVKIIFNETIVVTGTPQLTLTTDVAGSGTTAVNYNGTITSENSGTNNTMNFTYTVAEGDNSSDLDYASTSALALNGGTIKDSAGNDADRTLASPGAANSLGANKALVIDGIKPTMTITAAEVSDGDTSNDATLSLTFTSSESTTDFVVGDITVTNGSLGTLSGSGTTYTATFTPTGGAQAGLACTIDVAADTFTDAAGNGNTVADQFNWTYDNVAPTILDVSSSKVNGSYKAGEQIPITIQFSESVTVTGTPQLTLETGATDRIAGYTSGTGSSILTFTYTVQSGDTSSDLEYVNTSSLALNSGTIKDSAGNNATLTLPTLAASGGTNSLAANKDIVIDTTAPASFTVGTVESTGGTVESGYWNSTNTGLNISLNLPNDSTLVGGTIQLLVRQTAESPIPWSSATNLDSAYTIQSGDINGSKTLSVTSTVFEGLSIFIENFTMEFNATITDSAGNATTLTKSSDQIHIDQTAPSFSSVAAADGAYKAGDVIDITVTWNESVYVTNTPTLTLSNSATASYDSGDGSTSLVFKYTVGGSDNETNDLSVSSYSGTIQDEAGNAAGAVSGDLGNVIIDVTAPTATISYSSNGPYKNGETVVITATFSEDISDNPVMQIAITGSSTLGNVTATNMTKTSSTVYTYSYSVPTGDGTGTITLSTGTDTAGNVITASPTNNTFEVDNTAPSINAIATSDFSWGAILNATEDDSDGTVSVTTVGVEDGQTLTITLNSATYTNTISSNATTVTISAAGLQALTNGQSYTMTADVSDLAGNAAPQVTSASFSVDRTAPTVSNVTSTDNNGTYKLNDLIHIDVVFTEAVDVTGTPQLTLETGSSDAVVNYSSGTGTTTLTFEYTVGTGHTATDLDYTSTTALALN